MSPSLAASYALRKTLAVVGITLVDKAGLKLTAILFLLLEYCHTDTCHHSYMILFFLVLLFVLCLLFEARSSVAQAGFRSAM